MIYVGIDLGGMSAKSGVFKDGKLILKERVATNPLDGAQGVAEKLAALAQSVTAHAGLSFHDVRAIGIGSPGVINSQTGVVAKWGNYNWINVPLGAAVAEITGKPVYLTNDANAAALGEAKFGVGEQYKDCLLITLGTGVGGGIVLDGKLFEGFCSAGAEVGHMVIRTNGEQCGCGRRGCFEQYSSASALLRETRKAMKAHPESLLWQTTGGDEEKVEGSTSFKCAAMGDPVAQKVVDEYVCNLGEGSANLVNIVRPQAIMLGGGVSNAGDALLTPLKAYVNENIYVDTEYAPLEIVRAKLGNDAGIYGAYAYAMQREEENF
ncbi:MAG: ROK family protein [Clostridia bacterium]|nr:ROK family protein [Clostridia bacterium]